MHLAIDNLTNTKATVERVLGLKSPVSPEVALAVLNKQMEQAEKILQTEIVSHSSQATEIGSRVLNLLLCTKQIISNAMSDFQINSINALVRHISEPSGFISGQIKRKIFDNLPCFSLRYFSAPIIPV